MGEGRSPNGVRLSARIWRDCTFKKFVTERFRELHLPYVPGGGPSKEWVREHGGTPRCPGCSGEATSSRHSVRCVRRYQRWLRDAVDNALEELDRDPPPAQGPPAKRVGFGDSEVREFSAPSAPSEGEVEVPQIDAEANDILVITSHRCPPRTREKMI